MSFPRYDIVGSFLRPAALKEAREKFARGEDFGKLAEGVPTLKAVKHLSDTYNIDMPISQALYQAIYEKGNIKEIIGKLFERSLKKEFDNM